MFVIWSDDGIYGNENDCLEILVFQESGTPFFLHTYILGFFFDEQNVEY
jgi:hypothetical protein